MLTGTTTYTTAPLEANCNCTYML